MGAFFRQEKNGESRPRPTASWGSLSKQGYYTRIGKVTDANKHSRRVRAGEDSVFRPYDCSPPLPVASHSENRKVQGYGQRTNAGSPINGYFEGSLIHERDQIHPCDTHV